MHSMLLSAFFAASASALALPYQNTSVPSSRPAAAAGSTPAGLKGIVFNGGYNVNQFDKIGAANYWVSFGLDISGTPTDKARAAHIPMMAFASHVPDAVKLVNSDNAPEWLLTFNEPDFSYGGFTPTMGPQEAANAIRPLLDSPGSKTKFVAPVPADPNSSWLADFYAACGCQSFFSAYNIHIYTPTVDGVKNSLNSFHNKWSDKPTWITEIAPGNAEPACSLSWDQAGEFMRGIYEFSAGSGFVEKVFWNTGNQIDAGDHNVCNSYLLDMGNNETPLMEYYRGL